jgi:hypothetical protein
MTSLLVILALVLAAASPQPAHAAGPGGGKPYTCNPQAECLARAAGLKGAAADAARRDCSRMPTQGTCFGPDDTKADRSSGRGDVDRADSPDRKRR